MGQEATQHCHPTRQENRRGSSMIILAFCLEVIASLWCREEKP